MTGQSDTSQGAESARGIATIAIHHPTMQPDPAFVQGSPRGTTHDVHGGGNPRLIAIFDDSIDLNARLGRSVVPVVFGLRPGITTVGSDPACDVVLPDTAAHQAEVRRDDLDEYRIFDTSADWSSRLDGRYSAGQSLHSGDRVTFGPWTFVYARAAFADHGSPYGGHSGGMPHGMRPKQPTPRPRGTSATGGAEPTTDDPGEYC